MVQLLIFLSEQQKVFRPKHSFHRWKASIQK